MNRQKQIYFHVGLGKTASTYLQNRFFTVLKGIYYIHTSLYKKSKNIIRNTDHPKYLVSREFDQQLEEQCQWFSADFPQSKIIVFLRQQDSWIASQYKRFVKNGFPGTFTEFIDVENDNGYWKKEDLLFYPKLKIIEQYFHSRPLVLFYSDFKKDPKGIFDRLCEFMDAGYDINDVDLSPKHVSYNEKQLKVIRKIGWRFFRPNMPPINNPVLRFLRRMYHMAIRYPILYGALLFPDAWVSPEPLIPPAELEKVKKAFEEDWKKCQEYAASVAPGSAVE